MSHADLRRLSRYRLYDIDRVDQRDDALVERLARALGPFVTRYHRAEVRGVERVPPGPALFVANHNAGLWTPDSWLLCAALWRAHGVEGVPYGLGHEVVLGAPVFNQILIPLGAVRASHDNALRLFAAGRKVLVYPGGDVDSLRPFRHRDRIVFDGRRGYIRLALRAGVPVVPAVAAGAHSTFLVIDDLRWLARALGIDRRLRLKVMPLILSFPLGLTVGPLLPYLPFPSRILMEVLEPIRFELSGDAAAADEDYVSACAAEVESRMQAALTRLAAERRQPSRAASSATV